MKILWLGETKLARIQTLVFVTSKPAFDLAHHTMFCLISYLSLSPLHLFSSMERLSDLAMNNIMKVAVLPSVPGVY